MRLPVKIATCFLVLVGGGLLAGCDGEPEKAKAEVVRPVRAMKISDAAGFKRRKFSGRAKATKELDMAFNISGQVTQLKVKVGDADLKLLFDPKAKNTVLDIEPADRAGLEITNSNSGFKDQAGSTTYIV